MLGRIVRGYLTAIGLFVVLLFSTPTPAYAASCTQVAYGAWAVASHWNCLPGGAVVPAPDDDVVTSTTLAIFVNIPVVRNANTTFNREVYIELPGIITNYGVIENNYSLQISSGGALVNFGDINNAAIFTLAPWTGATLTNYGTITNYNIFSIYPTTTFINYGTIRVAYGSLFNSGTLINCGTIIGTVTGNPVETTGCPESEPSETAPDDRLNWKHGDSYARLYVVTDEDGNAAVQMYCLDNGNTGTLALSITQADLQDQPEQPSVNTLVEQSDLCHTQFYILTTGEYQINVGPDSEGKHFVYIFRDLSGAGFYWYEFNTLDIVG
jgi:hypothetical protein